MSKTTITYIHGWGSGPEIWQDVINELPEFTHKTLNLGFTGKEANIEFTNAIYVTHSMGTMVALKNAYKQINALIAINGFSHFMPFTKPQTLDRMLENLKQTPEQQMQDFWQTTNLPANQTINQNQLKQGLGWLKNWDTTNELESLTCPILSIYGDTDPILNKQRMNKHWDGYTTHIIKNAGHNIPLSHASFCANKIREAANAF
ncbi:MAG: alpha/beta fold hydrolase [Bdellovibrionales bacterium]